MRADFDLTLSQKSRAPSLDSSPSLGGKAVANQESDTFRNNSLKSESVDKEQEDNVETEILLSSGFSMYLKLLLDFSLKKATRNPIKSSRYLSVVLIYLYEYFLVGG